MPFIFAMPHKIKMPPKSILLFGGITAYTKHQLKTIQKIEHNLAYMDYAMIFCL